MNGSASSSESAKFETGALGSVGEKDKGMGSSRCRVHLIDLIEHEMWRAVRKDMQLLTSRFVLRDFVEDAVACEAVALVLHVAWQSVPEDLVCRDRERRGTQPQKKFGRCVHLPPRAARPPQAGGCVSCPPSRMCCVFTRNQVTNQCSSFLFFPPPASGAFKMLLALIYAFLSAFLVVLLGFFYAQVIAFIDPEQRCSSPPGTIRLFEWVYGCATWLRTKASSSSNNNSNRLAASALAAGAPSPSPHLGNNNSAASACGVRIQTVQVQNDSQQQQQLRPDINLLLGMLLFVVCWSSTRVLSIASAENMSGSAFLLESATFLWVFAEAASRAQRSEALKSAEARAKLVLVLLLASVLAVLLQWYECAAFAYVKACAAFAYVKACALFAPYPPYFLLLLRIEQTTTTFFF